MKEVLGPQSKAFMSNLVMGKRVRCKLEGTMTHDHWVGICYREGQDVAVDFPEPTQGWASDGVGHNLLLSNLRDIYGSALLC
jgi:hypothetical protein